MITLKNFIGGKFHKPCSGRFMDSFNPATEEVLCQVPLSDKDDIEKAVQAAREAFEGWIHLGHEERAGWLDKIADLIDERREEFIAAESADQGKPISQAAVLDVPRASYNFRFFAGIIRHELSVAAPISNQNFSYVRREPIGVAGLISPWNLPIYLLTWKIAPAIAYGNTCVAKPSELTSYTAYLLAEVIEKSGLPPGVINIVFGRGDDAGQALVEHPGIDVISFTGGTVTGKKIAEASAKQLKKFSLELGGKNPTIVMADADLTKHMKSIMRTAFLNQGEICVCGSRIYVHRDIYAEFMEKLVSEVSSLHVGDPRSRRTFMGPLVSKEHRDKVKGYVDEAVDRGADVHCGAKIPRELEKGYFYLPTVLSPPGRNLEEKLAAAKEFHSWKIQQEEVFGPVVTVVPFEDEAEMIKMANGTRYGLTATIWTESLRHAHEISSLIQAGAIWVNGWLSRDLRMPFGGYKESGIGREGQLNSVEVFTQSKTINIAW